MLSYISISLWLFVELSIMIMHRWIISISSLINDFISHYIQITNIFACIQICRINILKKYIWWNPRHATSLLNVKGHPL